MAPPNTQKRVKGISIFRPFIYGTTSHKFSDKYPKPAGVPDDHTHSWTVFVRGVDDSDITYWCRKVQFKLHDSYPQPLRSEFLPISFLLFSSLMTMVHFHSRNPNHQSFVNKKR
ncbi:NuA4 histone H4 acetyltransferase complex and the SWR1 complex subunit [Clarireedia jacksonii]